MTRAPTPSVAKPSTKSFRWMRLGPAALALRNFSCSPLHLAWALALPRPFRCLAAACQCRSPAARRCLRCLNRFLAALLKALGDSGSHAAIFWLPTMRLRAVRLVGNPLRAASHHAQGTALLHGPPFGCRCRCSCSCSCCCCCGCCCRFHTRLDSSSSFRAQLAFSACNSPMMMPLALGSPSAMATILCTTMP